MNLKSEAKIGLIVLGTIIAVIWGINFLKGKNVLKRSEVYYAVYENVSGLENSAATGPPRRAIGVKRTFARASWRHS
jgi:phospholipid/cholesterol/gamma-HCH transport system substrate-binding protein